MNYNPSSKLEYMLNEDILVEGKVRKFAAGLMAIIQSPTHGKPRRRASNAMAEIGQAYNDLNIKILRHPDINIDRDSEDREVQKEFETNPHLQELWEDFLDTVKSIMKSFKITPEELQKYYPAMSDTEKKFVATFHGMAANNHWRKLGYFVGTVLIVTDLRLWALGHTGAAIVVLGVLNTLILHRL